MTGDSVALVLEEDEPHVVRRIGQPPRRPPHRERALQREHGRLEPVQRGERLRLGVASADAP